MKIFTAAILGLSLLPAGVVADTTYPGALVMGTGYALDTPDGFPGSVYPNLNDPLSMVGRIASVDAPFAGLVPPGNWEITYVLEGASCAGGGIWDNIPCSGGTFGWYQAGTLTFYLDTTPDADFLMPASFRDGDPILVASVTRVDIWDDDPTGACPFVEEQPDWSCSFVFTGGTWFDEASSNGTGFEGRTIGEIYGSPSPVLYAIGYRFELDGTIDVIAPVATQQSTWGAVKAMYR